MRRQLGIPYVLPAVLLVQLRQEKFMTDQEALAALAALRAHTSADEQAEA
jgi:hypothetical protein